MTSSNPFSVPTETVEAGLLHSCTSIEQWLKLNFLTEEDFSTHKEIFKFYQNHLNEYGSIPTSSIVNSRFSWQPPIGEFNYWLDEMRKYSLARKVLNVIQEGYNSISDPNRSLDILLEKLSLIRSNQTNQIQPTDASASDRLDLFDARTEYIFNGENMLGLRTGMKRIDETKVGWTPGSLIGVYARPGVGKTWWLIWQGIHAWMDGKKVLAITPEMPSNFLNLRIDTVTAAEMEMPIDYNKLLTGDPSIRQNYSLLTQAMSQSTRWWTYSSLNERPISLSDIASLIRLHDPDIVLIDGISLIHMPGNSQTWEKMKDLCYGAKNMATIYEVPVIMTHQSVRRPNAGSAGDRDRMVTGRGDDFIMPSLNDAAYGDAFVQACSDVITMCGDAESSNVTWYSLRKYRERGWSSPLPPRMAFACDFGRGKIIDLSEHGYQPDVAGNETRRLIGHI